MATASVIRRRAQEAAKFAQEIVDDPEYRKNFRARAVAGLLAPGVENVLLYYRFGKPVDRIEINEVATSDLESMSAEELADRAETIAFAIRQMRDDERLQEQEQKLRYEILENGLSPDLSMMKPEPLTLDSVAPPEFLERLRVN